MKKRIFIAINLPENIRAAIKKEIGRLAVIAPGWMRFMPEDNWHLTISFLGYQDEISLRLIQEAAKRVADNSSAPTIDFNRLTYGPVDSKKHSAARMIWLVCSAETSKALAKLKDEIENLLIQNKVEFKKEDRNFIAHLTLARFDPISQTKLPVIEKVLNLFFGAEKLDVMESRLKRSGAEYEIMSGFVFAGG